MSHFPFLPIFVFWAAQDPSPFCQNVAQCMSFGASETGASVSKKQGPGAWGRARQRWRELRLLPEASRAQVTSGTSFSIMAKRFCLLAGAWVESHRAGVPLKGTYKPGLSRTAARGLQGHTCGVAEKPGVFGLEENQRPGLANLSRASCRRGFDLGEWELQGARF